MNLENQSSEPSTTSVGLRYGLLSGIVVGAFNLVLTVYQIENIRVTLLPITISILMLVLAMKDYKQACGGYMSFGKGMGVGVSTSGVSSLLSSLISIFYTQLIDPDYITRQLEKARIQMEANNHSDAEIEIGMEGARMLLLPSVALPLSVVGGIFLGTIFSLIVAAILQKKRNEFEL